MKNFLLLIIVATLLLFLPSFLTPGHPTTSGLRKVVIDAGHGGKDPGALGSNCKEKDIALSVALKLGWKIKKEFPDVKVIYTRKTDVFVELEERSAIANRNGADLFISIHANAVENGSVHGTETFVMGMHKTQENLDVAMRENSSILLEDNYEETYDNFNPKSMISYIKMANHQSAYVDQSLSLARKIEQEFQKTAGRKSRGVKQSGFLVLWRSSMPSVLVETGFITNSNEEKFLISEAGKNKIALGIFNAFKKYKTEIESN